MEYEAIVMLSRIFRYIRNMVPETRDFRWERSPRPVTHLISRTRYPIPGTLKLGFETRDLKPETLVISETRDPRPGTLKVGPEAHMINETRNTQLFSNLGPKNYDPNDP